ncbi:MAG TPA: VOC family protein [Acidimicrobiales bacterium]|nr:VOC family protein [Acidimicrobiales bacterium]
MAGRVHHSAIHVRDMDTSLRFYRDGIGLDVLMDHVFEGDWPTLFDAPGSTLRSIFLGDPAHADAGVVELVTFDPPGPAAPSPAHDDAENTTAGSSRAGTGFFLLSFYVDVDEVVARLGALGFGPGRRIEQAGPTGAVSMACVYDPDGIRIELVGVPSR